MKAARVLLFAAVGLSSLPFASGCALGTHLSATREDYRLYREVRLARTLEDRLGAGHRYLRQQPRGKWRAEVHDWFSRSEAAYYRAARDSLPALRAYLLAMPDGPHAAAVTSRIVELEAERGFAAGREERALSAARGVQLELAEAAEQRRAFASEIVDWIERLAAIDTFGQPTSALDDGLIYRFRLQEPRGACTGDLCKKSLALGYRIPEERRLAERVAFLDVVFELEGGGVRRAILSGPELWSRLGEALELRAVELARPQTRVEAIGRVLPLLENALEERLPEARCRRDPLSPAILVRECDGMRVTASAGASGEEPDQIVFEPAGAP